MMSLTAFAAASAQPATPDSENGRYSFNAVVDGVLRLDTPDRSGLAVQSERRRLDLQSGSRRAVGAGDRDRPPAGRKRDTEEGTVGPWAAGTRCAKSARRRAAGESELKLPSDAEVDKVISFLEKAWRRLLEMGREVLKDVERKN